MTTQQPPSPASELERIRLRLDLSQEDMARALGLRLRTYQRYEKGETSKVPYDVVERAKGLKKKDC
jgi:transcriptional regulator with XRE-family HTH domain